MRSEHVLVVLSSKHILSESSLLLKAYYYLYYEEIFENVPISSSNLLTIIDSIFLPTIELLLKQIN